MTRAHVVATIAVALAVVAPEAAAERVAVKVIEIAGGHAYVEPGARAGLRPGASVRIAGVTLVIVEVTEKTAVVRIGTTRIAVGDRGVADVARERDAGSGRLPPPRPPATWTGQWPDPVLPASRQSPAAVPLGRGRAPGRVHATVLGTAIASFDRRRRDGGGGEDGEDDEDGEGGGAPEGEAQARVIVSYDLWQDRGIAADLDVAARAYTTPGATGSRTPVWVRAAQLRYGAATDPRLALGRLPWAALGVGVLDGMRASARLGTLELAAFGGIVPDAFDGRPDPGATRFGAELIYDDALAGWAPRLALTAYGSTWDGTLDERRASASAGIARGGFRLDGWAEAQAFAAGNPWGARPVELTGAGLGADYRRRGVHAGVELAMLRPERSLRLAAVLPPDWLCARVPRPGDVADEACAGGDLWTWATASMGIARPRWLVDVGGSVGLTRGIVRAADAMAFGRVELRGLPRHGRVFGGGAWGRTAFVDSVGAELGVGASPIDDVELTASYRPELLAYRASTETWLLHSGLVEARWAWDTELDLGIAGIATTGPDRDALTVMATVAWRPLP